MAFTCRGKGSNVQPHQHETVYEARVCHGLIAVQRTTIQPVERLATQRQLDYISALGGDRVRAEQMKVAEASAYIKLLQKSGKASAQHTVTATATGEAPLPPAPKTPYVSKVPLMMFDAVPDGYYAWAPDEETALTFMRFSTRKSGKLKGARIVQTQHGDRLEIRWVHWPSGSVSVYAKSVEDKIIGVIIDSRTAARRYARELGRCSRCNKHLTDERSRHYGIGPECEKYWPFMIVEVDDENEGRSYEEMQRR